ncbi:MAG: flagellar FliJ family protein [Chthonomonas sp.]|nr:flagellar FliJ family protein [Chthonomonas sp.]
MAKFKFRLETLRMVRAQEAEDAKVALLQAQRERIEMEGQISELTARRRESMKESKAKNFGDRVTLQHWMDALDLQQHQAEAALCILLNEEEACREIWHKRQQASDALEKLRERHKQEFDLEVIRREQADLDEWAVMRRKA